ncbi:hypothetical protein [Roseiarcus sp.]|uniref:hypothetical protein n=1 Tax=Roseiarcus sp. TaxID=1969460 RepID=UPI003D102ECE
MASGTGGNILIGQSIREDLFPQSGVARGRAANRRRIQGAHVRGQSGDHIGRYAVGHIGHHGVQPPALKEGVQLIFDILRLLPGEARHGVKPAKTLCGRTMTGRAIFEFRFNTPGSRLGLMTGRGRQKKRQGRCQRHTQTNSFHLPRLPPLPFFAARNLLAS